MVKENFFQGPIRLKKNFLELVTGRKVPVRKASGYAGLWGRAGGGTKKAHPFRSGLKQFL